MNPHNDLLQRIMDETTVVKIDDNRTHGTIFEEQFEAENHPISLQSKGVFDFSSLENHWENKWNSFGDRWTDERQNFRFLWYETRAFSESYRLYRENFAAALNLSFERGEGPVSQRNRHDLRAELAIRSMYEYGKQSIDLLHELSETNIDIGNIVDEQAHGVFLSQFRETRNKFLTHYHNPDAYRDLIFDPSFISLEGTGSLFEVYIHLQNQLEHAYSAYINHHSDYFRLEEILVNIIRSF